MDGDTPLDPEEFAHRVSAFLEWMPTVGTGEKGLARLADHFGRGSSQFPVTRIDVREYDRPNPQVALDARPGRPGCAFELLGFAASPRAHRARALAADCEGPLGMADIDLVAEERTRVNASATALLFELLARSTGWARTQTSSS